MGDYRATITIWFNDGESAEDPYGLANAIMSKTWCDAWRIEKIEEEVEEEDF